MVSVTLYRNGTTAIGSPILPISAGAISLGPTSSMCFMTGLPAFGGMSLDTLLDGLFRRLMGWVALRIDTDFVRDHAPLHKHEVATEG